MKKEQTFISKLEDINNITVDFERWGDKRISTVEKKVRSFYNNCNNIIKNAIQKGAIKLNIYSTDNSGNNAKLVKTINIEELLL